MTAVEVRDGPDDYGVLVYGFGDDVVAPPGYTVEGKGVSVLISYDPGEGRLGVGRLTSLQSHHGLQRLRNEGSRSVLGLCCQY